MHTKQERIDRRPLKAKRNGLQHRIIGHPPRLPAPNGLLWSIARRSRSTSYSIGSRRRPGCFHSAWAVPLRLVRFTPRTVWFHTPSGLFGSPGVYLVHTPPGLVHSPACSVHVPAKTAPDPGPFGSSVNQDRPSSRLALKSGSVAHTPGLLVGQARARAQTPTVWFTLRPVWFTLRPAWFTARLVRFTLRRKPPKIRAPLGRV